MCLTIQDKDLLVIAYQFNDNDVIREYEILESFEVIYRRAYPLYGRRLSMGVRHGTDGKYVYFQVLPQNEVLKKQDQSEYFVYSPNLQTTSVLSHSFQA